MTRSLRIGLPVLFLLGALTAAHGNEAAPPRERIPPRERKEVLPRGARRATLTVEVDDRVKEPRLQIPANLLPAAAPATAPRKADAWHLPTVVAGVALTLSLASGGLWLLRRGTTRRAAAGALLLALFALGGTALFADIPGPGQRARPRPPAPAGPLPTLLLPADVRLSPNIVVEVVEKGDGVKLIVNKAMLGKPGGSAEAPAPAPKKAD
ncbi:MAG TPA: hypothetical protein VFE78_06920 [Gemmataceae bacterium]|jgi:hypothetical protein|nr:hypothetical protein [Gemmataceae bacterium]